MLFKVGDIVNLSITLGEKISGIPEYQMRDIRDHGPYRIKEISESADQVQLEGFKYPYYAISPKWLEYADPRSYRKPAIDKVVVNSFHQLNFFAEERGRKKPEYPTKHIVNVEHYRGESEYEEMLRKLVGWYFSRETASMEFHNLMRKAREVLPTRKSKVEDYS